MQVEKFCPRHPTRRTLHTCRRCSRPICDHCETETGGRFCSPQCATQFREFQEKVHDGFHTRRRRFSLLGCLRSTIISAALLIVIWIALWQLTGTTNPTQMATELSKMLRLLF